MNMYCAYIVLFRRGEGKGEGTFTGRSVGEQIYTARSKDKKKRPICNYCTSNSSQNKAISPYGMVIRFKKYWKVNRSRPCLTKWYLQYEEDVKR
jgi:hypothetical protein